MDPTRVNLNKGEADDVPTQLRASTSLGVMGSGPPTVGSVPVVVTQIDRKTLQEYKSKLGGLLGTLLNAIGDIDPKQLNRAKSAASSKTWKSDAAQMLAEGMINRDQPKIYAFCQMLMSDLGVPMPQIGALWNDPDVGEVAAVQHLQGTGAVLRETPLGKMAKAMKMPPNGANSGEALGAFAERNRAGLAFWGAVSAAYTSKLRGDVHVFLPKGITVGSIFWNDELPVLWERKRLGEVNQVLFHLQHPVSGIWQNGVAFEDLTIVDAYAADRNGANFGAADLTKDTTESEIRGTMEKNFRVELQKPIAVRPLAEGLSGALQRAQRRLDPDAKPEIVKRALLGWIQRHREAKLAAK